MVNTIWKNVFTQILATSGVMALITQTGIIDGWTSPNVARLIQANATIPLTPSEGSWLATSFTLGKFVSVILVPIFIELAGTKNAIFYAFIPVSVCWIMIMTANSAMYLYIARFLSGVSYTLAYTCSFIYLGEIIMPIYRGTFISITSIGYSVGALVSTVSETYLQWVVSSTMYLVPCLLAMLLFAWLPDSPYRLVKNNDLTKAHASLVWYRGHNQIDAEMKDIVEYVESTSRITFAEKLRQLKSPVIQKSTALVSLAKLLPQLCGVLNVVFFMEVILTKGKSYLVEPSEMVVYANVISLVATVFTVNLTDKFGRRTLLIISSTLLSLALLGLSLHYYLLNSIKVDPVKIQSLPIASIVVLTATFSTGYTAVMVTLLGEMFPNSIKSIAVTIVTFAANLTAFVSTFAYQFFIDSIGETYVFLMYAIFMAASMLIFLFFLPETKGKSLQEIQNDLNKRTISK